MLIAVPDACEHLEETAQSLAFARRAMRVKNTPVVNEDIKATHAELLAELDSRDAASFELQEEMSKLQAELLGVQQAFTVRTASVMLRLTSCWISATVLGSVSQCCIHGQY